MPRKDDLIRRKCLHFPHFCAIEVSDDWAGLSRRQIEMEVWCRQRAGAGGFAKQGRMGAERNSLEYRFKTSEIATEFHAVFGGELGPGTE